MKLSLKIVFVGIITLLGMLSKDVLAQKGGISYAFDGNQVVATLRPGQSEKPLDSLLFSLGTNEKEIAAWRENKNNETTESGWKLVKSSRNILVFTKPIQEIKGDQTFLKHGLDPLKPAPKTITRMHHQYGANQFKKPTVTVEGNQVKFLLPAYFDAEKVFLSGNFNDWSLSANPMKRTSRGWETEVELDPGKHLYKFVVDGQWKLDRENEIREEDGYGNMNSVYYQPNHTFFLPGFTQAKKVYLAGSFNDWKEKELRLTRNGEGWELPVFLVEGSYTYRYIVDDEWVTDPSNPDSRPNEWGDLNSLVTLGAPTSFELNTFPRTENVYLTGDFNDWKEEELPMQQAHKGGAWKLSHVLKPGNYEYKFVAGGSWIPDPANPHTVGSGTEKKSVIAVEPNYTFRLKGFADARNVLLSGSFNGWPEDGYTMVRKGNEWQISLHIPPGKNHYKFIVDGAWMADPANPLWEENEFGTKNSVLWVK